jgi:hypothetical protein
LAFLMALATTKLSADTGAEIMMLKACKALEKLFSEM